MLLARNETSTFPNFLKSSSLWDSLGPRAYWVNYGMVQGVSTRKGTAVFLGQIIMGVGNASVF